MKRFTTQSFFPKKNCNPQVQRSVNSQIPFVLIRGAFSGSTNRESGNILIALIAFLVVIIGSLSLANRAFGGLFGFVAQAENREARDVAESGIIEIANELNKENNREMLIAGRGRTPWNSSLVNDCTKYNDLGVLVDSDGAVPSGKAISYGSGAEQNLGGDASKKFQLEEIKYLEVGDRSSLSGYNLPTENIAKGAEKSYLRITVIGKVFDRNGRETGRSRVAREFEVVPKCCKRSFGPQQIGNDNYGSDARSCPVVTEEGGQSGLIVGLSGGGLTNSSKNTFDIRDLNNELVTRAVCWSGSADGSTGYSAPNPECLENDLGIGNLSLVPQPFDFCFPEYNKAVSSQSSSCSGVTALNPEGFNASLNNAYSATFGTTYVYVSLTSKSVPLTTTTVTRVPGSCDSNPAATNQKCVTITQSNIDPNTEPGSFKTVIINTSSATLNGIYISKDFDGNLGTLQYHQFTDDISTPELTGANSNVIRPEVLACNLANNGVISSCGTTAWSGGSGLICAVQPTYLLTAGLNPLTASCRIQNLRTNSGNKNIVFDTSNGNLNLHFEYQSGDPSYKFVNLGGAGTTDHVQCNSSLLGFGLGSNQFNPTLYNPISSGGCPSRPNFTNTRYNEALNIYSNAPGEFIFKGSNAALVMNIYAPFANVDWNGGGRAAPNFSGRIWANSIELNGSISMRVNGLNPGFCFDGSCAEDGETVWDYIARSFTHSSNF